MITRTVPDIAGGSISSSGVNALFFFRPIADIRRSHSGSTRVLRHRHWRDIMTNPIPTLEDRDPYADRRVYPRVPVALPAFLHADGERQSVQILDLSSGGAKLTCPTIFLVGTTVLLDCGSLGCAATVRWQNGAILGVCFDDELDAREVSALMARSKAMAALMKTRG